ncbi:pyrroline-5-carboxylate reductase [Nocardioides phosphati]|uniref:Pyrroline-5-carboxylate reductase n=1 Tax=Nocardioides phosphati TaxID=1867775 RepID=A0ABQ2N8M5_9ACTN|nr:NAD(P)-binding domain-containing protein [Nocardioides phosphati]GGO88571.1 pyrroline-5-carboxylate reductase [Nocardioides phosphati]
MGLDGLRLGFIGTGAITAAMVRGLLRSDLRVGALLLSPRNATIAAELATLDDRVRVCASNQEVLDGADVICVAVVQQIVREVVGALEFAPRHHVITFVPGTPLGVLAELTGPAGSLARAVPLPAVEFGEGVTVVHPGDALTTRVFDALGGAVAVDDEAHFEPLFAATATMASFYAVQDAVTSWLGEQGVPAGAARHFVGGYYASLASEVERSPRALQELIAGMTPEGLNEQVHAELSAAGAYDHYGPALDRVLARLRATGADDADAVVDSRS